MWFVKPRPCSPFEDLLRQMILWDCDLEKVRIGPPADGGYVALRELCERTDTLYTFGVGDDDRFEHDFADRFPKAKVNLFDPYIDAPPADHPSFTFHKRGIGLGHPNLNDVHPNSTLKMDIEGDEWDAFQYCISEWELGKFLQLIVEFHIVHVEWIPEERLTPYFRGFYRERWAKINDKLFRQYSRVIREIQKHFYIVHIHANNALPMNEFEGKKFPPLLEVTFARNDLVKIKKFKGMLPVAGLDKQNKTDRPDIEGYYPFFDVDEEMIS